MCNVKKMYTVYLLNNSEFKKNYIIEDVNSPLDALVKFSLDREHGYLSESTMTFIDKFGTWSVKSYIDARLTFPERGLNVETVA